MTTAPHKNITSGWLPRFGENKREGRAAERVEGCSSVSNDRGGREAVRHLEEDNQVLFLPSLYYSYFSLN